MFANTRTLDGSQSKEEKERSELITKAFKGVKELGAKLKMSLHEID